ncbi:methyltransferase type 11 [Candidatus Magnetomorum sp. HK-1]|nr:methyltransferase type 11 [Candidatus Magnetomorum sp. HK-1]
MNQSEKTIKLEVEKNFASAEHLYYEKRYNDALKICEDILKKEKSHAPTINLAGCIFCSLKTKKSMRIAIELFETVLQLKSDYAEAYHNLGKVYFLLGHNSKAIENQRLALNIKPDFFNAHLSLSDAIMPGDIYHQLLKSFHNWLKPRGYLEIGVETGESLCIAQMPTQSIGIDPNPQIKYAFKTSTKIFSMTSDAFFINYNLKTELNHKPLDMAFIDGLHLFEQTLKDFISVEKNSHPDTIVLVHDCIPIDQLSSSRTRTTTFWSGDVWKLIPCLKTYRPDLKIFTIMAKPTGLALITKLDPKSTILEDQFDSIIKKFINLDYSSIEKEWQTILNTVPNNWTNIQNLLL